MTNASCGYQALGHYCQSGRVQFISRYRNENDYCVGGTRISVSDDGHVHSACYSVTDADLHAILNYELDKYAEYIHWHVEQKQRGWTGIPLAPFNDALVNMRL